MAEYQLVPTLPGTTGAVRRVSDDAFIPFDPANRDYQEFLRYIEAGGVVDDPPTSAQPAEQPA
jgi:hypothetical protein